MRTKETVLKLSLLFFGWRVALFVVPIFVLFLFQSFISPNFLEYAPSFPYASSILAPSGLPQWLYSWGNFDGVHYLTIADKGYFGTGLIQAFFPLYPMLIEAVSYAVPGSLTSALLVSNIFAWVSVILFYYLVKKDFPKYAWTATIIFLLFPTSFFLVGIYNESVFLAMVFASFLFARNKHWLWTGIFAAFASATRIVGVFLVPALLLELWIQYRSSTKNPTLGNFLSQHIAHICMILVGTLGLVIYMAYLQKVFYDALYFLHVQSEFGAGREETIITLPQVLWRYIKILATSRPFDFKYYTYVQDMVISLATLAILIFAATPKKVFKKLRIDHHFKTLLSHPIPYSYLLFSFLAFILPTVTGTFSSMPRYVLACFPLFIWLAILLKDKKIALVSYLTISTFLLILNTILFLQGYWVA